MNANLANCLMVTPDKVYYSDPGNEAFRNYFKANVTSGAVPLNIWDVYHCNYGEIHCGTAVRRTLPHIPAWWEHDAIKTEWENEK